MTRYAHIARAGAAAWLVLGTGLLSLPAFASPLSDEPPVALESSSTQDSTTEPGEASSTPSSPAASSDPEPAGPTDIATSPTVDTDATPGETATVPTQETADEFATPAAETTETPAPLALLTESSPTLASPTVEMTATPAQASDTDESPSTVAPSETPSPTASETSTPTATASIETVLGASGSTVASFPAGAVLINEVAWAGTLASTSDEWIELWNPGPDPIALDGWTLTDGGDLAATLQGEIGASGFYLLERTDDSTVSDIAADRIYTGSLNNGGETLELRDPSGGLIDTANAAGGPWPAGSALARASMERHGAIDVPANWSTFPGLGGNGLDAAGNPIAGTPRQANAPTAPTITATPSLTPSPTPESSGATPAAPGAVVINEVAWAGTLASTSDEWIELLNPGSGEVSLEGWSLTDDGDIDIALQGRLSPGEYHLLERSDDQTVSTIAADWIYTGSLSNAGERLRLLDATGAEIDVVNPGGGPWPAGDADRRTSMERIDGRWQTFTGFFGTGLDAAGQGVRGTPRGPNSGLFPTPQPTWIPGRVVINEILMRPRYDWEGAGGVNSDDEFVEFYNRGPGAVNLKGWTLDDYVVGGSKPYTLPSIRLEAGEFVALFRSHTGIALNDDGDSVRLSAPDGSLVDKIRYRRGSAYNLSYGRLPDGHDTMVYGLWPTPGKRNVLFVPAGPYPKGTILINEVAWAGTLASANDEWIELWNPGPALIHLDGWVLTDDNDIRVDLTGPLPPGGYAVLERTDNSTISDLPATRIYTGALSDSGEILRLIDPSGAEIDAVGSAAEGWPAGDAASRASMERLEGSWIAFSGDFGRGRDAEGARVRGTPGGPNAVLVARENAAAASCGPAMIEAAVPCR